MLELIRVPSILRTSLLLTGAVMDLLQSRMRCVDVDIAMKIGYTIFPSSCVEKNQQLRTHIETKNENSSPEFKSSSQLEILSN